MKSRLLTLLALLWAVPALAGSVTERAEQSRSRATLEGLAQGPASNFGQTYENASARSGGTGAAYVEGGKGEVRPTLRQSVPSVTASRNAVPSPSSGEGGGVGQGGKKKEDGGIMGFISKNKWYIGGSIAGTIAGVLLGGGLMGGLLGVGIGLLISFLGPKIFS